MMELREIGNDYFKPYQVGVTGILKLKCFGDLRSHKGLNITNGGKVIIECNGTVYLENDIVESGGELEISAKEVVFGSGFEVKEGGVLNVSYK